MKKKHCFYIFLFWLLVLSPILLHGQSTSWIGGTSDKWRTASNWTNGVPDKSMDVIIGDISFTGPNQPQLAAKKGKGECRSITIGNGTIAATFTCNDDLQISKDIVIGNNGAFNHNEKNLKIEGDFMNSGVYTESSNKTVIFTGNSQLIGGNSVTTFKKIAVYAGCQVTLGANIVVNNSILNRGSINPTKDFSISGAGEIELRGSGTLIVMKSTFDGNYSLTGGIVLASSASIVNYASSIIDQTIEKDHEYRVLILSGGMTKYVEGNLVIRNDLFIEGGTMDLLTYTTDRKTRGGDMSISNNASLRIGGTNSFPDNYSNHFLAPTSTVDYYGTDQTIADEDYGNLILSSSSGVVTKTMPETALNISGNLTSLATAGTLTFTAGNTLSVLGDITLGSSTTFNGATYAHETNGDFTNNGIFTGVGGKFSSNAAGAIWSGYGVFNMGDVEINGNNTTLNKNSTLSINGSLTTVGGGTFVHSSAGTGSINMDGSGKSISGSGIVLTDLNIESGGSISTSNRIEIAGNLSIDGSLSATSGTITLSGASKTITGSGSLQFSNINVTGSITITKSFSVSGDVSVSGTFSSTLGEMIINGTSTFSGTASFLDLTINDAASLTMGSASRLNISGSESLVGTGTFDATTNVPNTVNYNSSGSQTITFSTFNILNLANGGTKTPSTGVTINGDFTIETGTEFNAGTFSHTIKGDLNNNGTFTPGSSTINLTGTNDATISGSITFNDVTINKASSNKVTLENSINVVNLDMLSGHLLTGANTVTITASRTGNGLIIGTITRTHAFTPSTDYAFEGPNNTINFSSINGSITSVTVIVDDDKLSTFPYRESINREYDINVTGNSTYSATLRLHYEDVDLNGNDEANLYLWNDGGTTTWVEVGRSYNDVTANWVEESGLTNLQNKWSLSDGLKVLSWNGSSSSSWTDPDNWTLTAGSPSSVPGSDEVAVIGDLVFSNNPTITNSAQAKTIIFESIKESSLTIGTSGTLNVGNILGDWSGDASHSIVVGMQSLIVNSDLILSEGTNNRYIDLMVDAGTVSIGGSLTQSGGANIVFSGAGSLNIGGDFNYVNGTFFMGSGQTTYNGVTSQIVGGVTYNDLNISKPTGIASIESRTSVSGDLNITTGGQLDVSADLDIEGNFDLGSGTTLNVSSATINIAGGWSINNGTFIPGSGTLVFDGTNSQSMDPGTYNNIIVNKSNGTLTLLGNLDINGDISILAGTIETSTFTISRTSLGGIVTLSAGTTVLFGGSSIQLLNFAKTNLDPTSTVEFYNSEPRFIPPVIYGNLVISNGGDNAKTMIGATKVSGDLIINSGSTLTAPTTTLNLAGNLTVGGTFNASSGSLILDGTNKNINGTITFNEVIVNGSYDIQSGNPTFDGHLHVTSTGDLDAGSSVVTLNDDFTNENIVFSKGVLTFTGTQVQTIRILNAISSTSTGVVNFNGTVSPIFNSNFVSTLATVNLNNTGGIKTSVGFIVLVAANVASGVIWDIGPFDLTIEGDLDNNGTITGEGQIHFNPNTFPVNINLGDYNSSGTTEFGGTMPINLTHNAQSFNSVIVSNSNALGVTPAANWTIDSDLLITSEAILNGGTGLSHTIAGNWTNNGTFNRENCLITFSGINNQTIDGFAATSFEDVTINKPSGEVFIETEVNLAGTLDILSSTTLDADGSGSGNLTLLSNASDDARVGVLATGAVVSGNLTIEKYFTGTGFKYWRHISSPIIGSTVADLQEEIPISGSFSGTDNGNNGIPAGAYPSLYYYDNAAAGSTLDDRWVNYPSSANTELLTSTGTEARGYALWARDTGPATFTLSGQLNQGTIDFMPTGNNERWNLLGNPYPSDIDWDNAGWTKTAIEGNSIYIWNGSQYLNWNGSIGSLGNGRIAKGQGFWIKGASSSVGLVATEAVKTTTPTATFRTYSKDKPSYIDLTVSAANYTDHAYVQCIDTAKFEFDIADAPKLNNSIFNLATMSSDSVVLSINVISGDACAFDIPISLWNTWDDSYSFGWNITQDLLNDYSISLQDKYTGQVYDLNSSGDGFDFFISNDAATKESDRFMLHFATANIDTTLVIETNQTCTDQGNATINLSTSQHGIDYTLWQDSHELVTLTGTGERLVFEIDSSLLSNGNNSFVIKARRSNCSTQEVEFRVDLEYINKPEIVKVTDGLTCSNSPVTLQASSAINATFFKWYENELDKEAITGEDSATFITPILKTSHIYYVSALNDLGCESERVPVEAKVNLLAQPIVTIDTVDFDSYELRSNYLKDNQWYYNNAPIEGETNQTLKTIEDGVYKVQVNSGGCTVMSDSLEVSMLVLALADLSEQFKPSMYPNPATENVMINFPKLTDQDVQVMISGINANVWQEVDISDQNNATITIDLRSYLPGTYILKVVVNTNPYNYRLIKL